ncbi:MAG: BCCT family transporter [Eubacteriales bacterium]|nr:BCCT family transporter [Eubacteriales bacterium]
MKENQKNMRGNLFGVLTPVFWIALVLTLIIVAGALLFPEAFQQATFNIRTFIGQNFAWYYLLLSTLLVLVCIFLIFSPIGKIKLGDPDSKPEHSTFSWFAMLFSAGMGIGLVFYGAAEPLSHFAVSAPEAEIFSREALRDALKYSFFHYGIHAWAIYALVALALSYFQFRKQEKTLISITLKPILKNKVSGIWGMVVDALTIFATVVGVATTLGFGAAQINGGLHELFDVPNGYRVQLIIIIVATCLFIWSAMSGVGKGVKILSDLNIVLALLLMGLAFLVGPKTEILNVAVHTLGEYAQDFFHLSLRTAPVNQNAQEWIQNWTIFYWSWWISWSPFVGVFIARISKGRSIREFLTCVLFIPSAFSFLWFSVFGVMSTRVVYEHPELAEKPYESMLFGVFQEYPLTMVLSVIAIILVFSFFITSADSATYVLAMQSENGSLNPHNKVKLVWGVLLAVIASVLMLRGGLDGLQNVLIIVALPFSIVLILLVVSVIVELNYEKNQMGLSIKPERFPEENEPFRSYEE